MAKMPKIELQDIQALGSKEVILLEQKEVTIYEDKKPTDKKQKVCVVVCPSNEFNKVNVKIAGNLIDVSNEVIQKKNSTLDCIFVSFKNFKGSLYTDYKTNEIKVSASADEVCITKKGTAQQW